MSKFVVSARKYRPTSFDEVIGQDHISRTLKNALQTDHLAQAFLFTGPRGVGKTTCARILAKIINCENPVDKVAACNQCGSCKAFNDNASFNIIELDAASNNGVDHMRALTEQVRFRPQEGKYKVFIIDEVHMLSSQAFNAFLKTLEEPPSYAIFILATTEKHKIIPTILSRCQIFDFKRIQMSDAVIQLEKIIAKEGMEAEKEALHIIANKADGAMRDALSIFDKVASASNGKITYKEVVANLNILDYEYYFRMTNAFLKEDITQVYLLLDEVIKNGFDPEIFILGLGDHFRDLLIAKNPATVKILDAGEDLKNRYVSQAQLAKSGFLLTGLNILNQCDINLPRAKNRRLHVELAISKITFINKVIAADLFGSTTAEEKKTKLPNESLENISAEVPPALLAKPIISNSEVSYTNTIPTSEPESKSIEHPEIKSKPAVVTEVNIQVSTVKHIEHITVPSSAETQNSMPTVSFFKKGGLSSLREKIISSDQQKAEARQNLSIENANLIWKKYVEEISSDSTRTILKQVIVGLEGKRLELIVGTQMAKNVIQQEENLLEKLRTELGLEDLIFDVIINKELFPETNEPKPMQLMTQKEKLTMLIEKHPLLNQMVRKLDLRLDNEFQ